MSGIRLHQVILGLGLGFCLACSGMTLPPELAELLGNEVPVEEAPKEEEPPGEVAARPLADQKEAGCGFTHRGEDGAIWFAEEVGGGYVMVNLTGTDIQLEPAEATTPAAEGSEVAAYEGVLGHIEVVRTGETGVVSVKVGDAVVPYKTTVKINECA